MPTYFITGANRGLGLEFARQLRARGDTVLGTARTAPSAKDLAATGATVIAMDAANADSIRQIESAANGRPIDVLINNAGVNSEAKRLADLSPEDLQQVFAVNSIAPLLVAKALLPSLRAGRQKKIINISSDMGSIAHNSGGSSYAYRGSKAALNMLTTCMANELRKEGFTCLALDPGWVRTDMGGQGAPLSPQDSISKMLRLIDNLTPNQSGKYMELNGRETPW